MHERNCFNCQHHRFCFLYDHVSLAINNNHNMLNIDNPESAPGKMMDVFYALAKACIEFTEI